MSGSAAPYPSPPTVPLAGCPIATTLGSLGRKWTLPVLRDIAFFPQASFGLIRKHNPGLRQRTLSLRLRQVVHEGLVRRVVPEDDPRHPYYELTAKGLEVWPILASLFQFGIQHHARTVFADGTPRDLREMFPKDASLMLGPLAGFAQTIPAPTAAPERAGPTQASGSRASRR